MVHLQICLQTQVQEINELLKKKTRSQFRLSLTTVSLSGEEEKQDTLGLLSPFSYYAKVPS